MFIPYHNENPTCVLDEMPHAVHFVVSHAATLYPLSLKRNQQNSPRSCDASGLAKTKIADDNEYRSGGSWCHCRRIAINPRFADYTLMWIASE